MLKNKKELRFDFIVKCIQGLLCAEIVHFFIHAILHQTSLELKNQINPHFFIAIVITALSSLIFLGFILKFRKSNVLLFIVFFLLPSFRAEYITTVNSQPPKLVYCPVTETLNYAVYFQIKLSSLRLSTFETWFQYPSLIVHSSMLVLILCCVGVLYKWWSKLFTPLV